MKKNAGFSLIELIVTVAIMGILSAGVVTIVLSRSNWEVKKASKEVSAALSETRAQALSRANAWMQIKYDGTKGYVISTSYSGDVVLGKSCTVSYGVRGDSSTQQIDGSHPFILSYDRASGAFLPVIGSVSTSTADDGSRLATYNYLAGDPLCEKITIVAGNNIGYELTLYPETGKHELNKK